MAHSQTNLWKFLSNQLQQQIPCMLLLVVDHKGSSPGRTGFKMVVSKNFDMEGSIGGGVMEHKLAALAHQQLQSNQYNILIKRQIHQASIGEDRSGMICSGEQTVVLLPINAQKANLIKLITEHLELGKPCVLQVNQQGLQLLDNDKSLKDYRFTGDDQWHYQEKLGYHHFLHIIGGGHISLALSKLAADLDFYVTVYDDRKDLHTMMENKYAHAQELIEYTQIPRLASTGNNYVVVMSFGYRTDGIIIRGLYPEVFPYLGLLGSQAKIDTLFEDLQKSGIASDWLQKIEAPAGVAIKSQTTSEIAVSISASLIRARQAIKTIN